jgi:hypothetical protein
MHLLAYIAATVAVACIVVFLAGQLLLLLLLLLQSQPSLLCYVVANLAVVTTPSGIRNSVGFDFHPQTGHLYFTDNGRDRIGDNSPDCELNSLPFTYNSYRSLVSRPRSGTMFKLAVKVNGKISNFGFPFCQTQGLGNPYRRNLGSGVPLVDPDLNRNNTAFNCSGEQHNTFLSLHIISNHFRFRVH